MAKGIFGFILCWIVLLALPPQAAGQARPEADDALAEVLRSLYVEAIDVGVTREARPRVKVTTRAPTKVGLKQAASLVAGFKSTTSARTRVCFQLDSGGTFTTAAKANLTADELAVLNVYLEGAATARSPQLALNLAASGLTSERAWLTFPARLAPATMAELLVMARSGTVKLTARLTLPPSDEASVEGLATLQTDKGPLKLKVVRPDYRPNAVRNRLVLRTPKGREISFQLSQVPQHADVAARLSKYGRQLLTKRLSVRSEGANPGFAVDYVVRRQRLKLLAYEFGVVPITSSGLQLGAPKEMRWLADVQVTNQLIGPCDVLVRPVFAPQTVLVEQSPIATYDPELDSRIHSVTVFDSKSQSVATKFSSASLPDKKGRVK